jgi:ribonuclease P protein component
MGLKKSSRITKNEEFQKILSKRKYISTAYFALYYDFRKEDHARYGISVGKKLGNAVVRNKIKRQVRMMIRELVNDEKMDLIIMVRPSYLNQDYSENKKDLENTLNKVRMKVH